MNDLIKTNLTMTSNEIAELTGKEHKSVNRDIRQMLDALKIDRYSFEHIYLDTYKRKQKQYLLNKELALTLVSGYNVKLRNAIIKRWQELEDQKPKELTRIEILETALQAEKENEALRLEKKELSKTIKEQEKDVEIVERIVNQDSLLSFSELSARTGLKQKDVRAFLVSNKILKTICVSNSKGQIVRKQYLPSRKGTSLNLVTSREIKKADKVYFQELYRPKMIKYMLDRIDTCGASTSNKNICGVLSEIQTPQMQLLKKGE